MLRLQALSIFEVKLMGDRLEMKLEKYCSASHKLIAG